MAWGVQTLARLGNMKAFAQVRRTTLGDPAQHSVDSGRVPALEATVVWMDKSEI